jgi:hypothetical protein
VNPSFVIAAAVLFSVAGVSAQNPGKDAFLLPSINSQQRGFSYVFHRF